MDEMEGRFMDPTGVTEGATNSIAPRAQSLDGAIVGLLWNGKHNGDKLLKSLGNLLARELPVKKVLFQLGAESGKPAPAAILDEMASKCDVVVAAAGD